MTSVYFIRHAVSPFSLGQEQRRGLSPAGLEDARKIADRLAGEGIDQIFSSSYRRAVETVSFLAAALNKDIIELEALRERAVGSLDIEIDEQQLLEAVQKSFQDPDYCLPGGETIREAQDRAIPVIQELIIDHEGKKIAIGTHGNIMTAILNYYNDSYGYEFWKSTTKPDIYKAEFESNKLVQLERLWEQR
ncbi:histidine phosphatase family protein [Paenibacillus filicis]|uniref:Histidine phosphatase family protein n=1 Tax=Paenibacillus gyeongsangnamensis TaxID=3388067 RepID=A0ABT4Q7E5_9BACL|nr:histidine phosphatase family protein [Paenibacillus filicis]MCZ8512795.1 histidine phosphatase family protein [Paenibacillus filicis]